MNQSNFTDIQLVESLPLSFLNVYRAKRLGRWFMLKALKPEYASDARMQALLKREFLQGYNLRHPVVAECYGYEEVAGVGRAIIMEWVEGDKLSNLVAEHKLDEDSVVDIVKALGSYFEYIHSLQAIHKTLRPDEVIVAQPGNYPKITDFGFNEAAMQHYAKRSAGPTRYLSPELMSPDAELDETTDSWTLGKIVADMNHSLAKPSAVLTRRAAELTDKDPQHRPYHYSRLQWRGKRGCGARGWLGALIGLIVGVGGAVGCWYAFMGGGSAAQDVTAEVIHDTVTIESHPIAPVDSNRTNLMSNIDGVVNRISEEEWSRMLTLMDDYAGSGESVDRSVTTDYYPNTKNRVERRVQAYIDDKLSTGDADYRLVRLGILSLVNAKMESLRDDEQSQTRLKEAFAKMKYKD